MKRIILTLVLSFLSFGANAALVDRSGGLIYDDVLDITWLQDANYTQTSGYDADGLMSWLDAKTWAAALSYGGHDDWRLPTSLQPDPSCTGGNGTTSWGWNCSGSEMGSLFYTTLNNAPYLTMSNDGPFNSTIQTSIGSQYYYWTSTVGPDPGVTHAWFFDFNSGMQFADQATADHYAWAVADGDVGAALIPLPAAVWLFGSALGLLGWMRRKTN